MYNNNNYYYCYCILIIIAHAHTEVMVEDEGCVNCLCPVGMLSSAAKRRGKNISRMM